MSWFVLQWMCIYKVEGDALTICFNPKNYILPDEFRTAADSDRVLFVFKRVKEQLPGEKGVKKRPDLSNSRPSLESKKTDLSDIQFFPEVKKVQGKANDPKKDGATAEKEKTDLEKLEGTWSGFADLEKLEGFAGRNDAKYYWTFNKDKVSCRWERKPPNEKDRGEFHYTCVLDSSKKPKELTLSRDGKNWVLAIYKLENGTLSIANFARSEIARPKGFTPKDAPIGGEGKGILLVFHLKREPEKVKQGKLDDTPQPKTDLERIQGSWSFVSQEFNGIKPEIGVKRHWTFKDGKATVSWKREPNPDVAGDQGNKGKTELTFTIDPSKSPKEITFSGEGGLKLMEVYKLENDTLTLCCFGKAEVARPKGFSVKDAGLDEGNPNLIVEMFKREQAVNKDDTPKEEANGEDNPKKADPYKANADVIDAKFKKFDTKAGTVTLQLETGKDQTYNLANKNMGSSRVDLQACKLEYSIVSPK